LDRSQDEFVVSDENPDESEEDPPSNDDSDTDFCSRRLRRHPSRPMRQSRRLRRKTPKRKCSDDDEEEESEENSSFFIYLFIFFLELCNFLTALTDRVFKKVLHLFIVLNGAFQVAHWQRIFLPLQEMRVCFLSQEDLEKDVATHSSILAWEILWTEEPGGLQSMGSQRIGHD